MTLSIKTVLKYDMQNAELKPQKRKGRFLNPFKREKNPENYSALFNCFFVTREDTAYLKLSAKTQEIFRAALWKKENK